MSFGNTPAQPSPQDDDHVLWFKFASAASSVAVTAGNPPQTPNNLDDDHSLLYKSAQALYSAST